MSQSRAARITVMLLLALVTGAAVARLPAAGTFRYVDDDRCPATGSGTLADPFCRIQDAICAAGPGDTVSVAPGSYHEAIRMKPDVSVISQAGAGATTIDAAGQPCTDNTFCAKRTGSQCSVVTFASGHTPATRLDGFTLTGGAGLIQTTKVAGGGIFVFSSPTIANNVITNNVLSGPLPQGRDLRGAGVYVSVGQPIITGNSITGNRAVPISGSSGSVTFGYGGGVWVGFSSYPVLTNNVIQGNRAGDPNAAYSLGGGGGLVVFPGAGATGPRIDRNLIADNQADTLGGGVCLLSLANTAAEAVVTNNVIVGNGARSGGGVYTYFNKSSVINNTVTGNDAFLGGGIYTSLSDPTLPIVVTNNIIEGNLVRMFGNGGGVYALDLDPNFDPTVCSNDIFGNQKNQCAGDLTDLTCLPGCDNFSAAPGFVGKPARDFHLAPASPAIDRASAAAAPQVDKDGRQRGVDGDGAPGSPRPGDVDVGAYEFPGACVPGAEICDGLDNDCDNQVDEGFLDTDGDAQADCIDADDDNDGVADGSDCAPLNAGAWGVAAEVAGLDVAGAAPTIVAFDQQVIGPATHYEILSGLVSRLQVTRSFQEGFCVGALVSTSPWQDPRPAPPPGDAWYYQSRAANACGPGTLGSALRDAAGAGDVCPRGVVDLDDDGSPSDLDCDDADPGRSPIQPEVCDGADNDCNQTVDDGNPGGGQACGVSAVGECRLGTTSCTGGAIACVGAVGPGPELCDQKDNDCDGIADDNVVDTDGDLLDDCTDTDDDNDMVPDTQDCAPLDATAFGVPVEIQDLDVLAGSPTPLVWTLQTLGSGTRYDVASGSLDASGSVDFSHGACLSSIAAPPAMDGRLQPAPGAVWYYLARSRNACGTATYGSPAQDTIPPCP